MTTDNLDAQDLGAEAFGGIIHEDVMDQVFDVSRIPLPLTDRIGTESSTNQFKTWPISTLPAPDITNAVVDGSAKSTAVSNIPARVGNRHQILEYTISVSTRARNVNTIGAADELARQVMEFNQAIRRDFEAIMLEGQASVVDNGDDTPGRLGGLSSWLTTNTQRGALGADGGFDLLTGLVDAPSNGTVRGLTELMIKNAANDVFVAGNGNPSILMSVPDLIRGLSTFMFTASARIATLQRDVEGVAEAQAIGSVNVFLTDHGVTLEMISNRLQQTYNLATAANMYLIDPGFIAKSYIHGPRVDPLGKVGLSDERQLSLDGTLVVHNEAAHAVIADLEPATTVVDS
jgi:hypothetical protein